MPYIRKPRKTTPWPINVCVVGSCHRSDHSLAGWCSALLSSSGAPVDMIWSDNPGTAISRLFLDVPFTLRETLWLFVDAYRALTNMGFWEAVKRGRIRLAGVDERTKGSVRCIVENPPTIISFGVPGKSGSGVIVDVQNYGYSLAESRYGENLTTAMPDNAGEMWLLERLYHQVEELGYFTNEYTEMLGKLHLGESWRNTGGSQAFYGFRSSYMDCEIEIPDDSEDESLVAQASYGGRCECRRIGEVDGPIYHYDVNQLYSEAAAMGHVPVRLIGKIDHESYEPYSPESYSTMIGDVTVRTSVPILPYRAMNEHGKEAQALTIWPTGTFRTQLAGPELWLAHETGCVVHTHALFDYECSDCLRTWANSMWSARGCAAPGMARVVKRIALSLYGKFGQKLKEWIPDPDDLPPDGMQVGDWYCMATDATVMRHRVIDEACAVESEQGYAKQSSPPVAAWVTSWARLILFRMLAAADEVYYYDTDSLWVGRQGKSNLEAAGMIHDRLGGLRLEAEYERVAFKGIKHYQIEALEVKSGIPSHADYLGNGLWRWQQQQTFNSHMGQQEWPTGGAVNHFYRGTELYRHGIVQADGKVVPHNLS